MFVSSIKRIANRAFRRTGLALALLAGTTATAANLTTEQTFSTADSARDNYMDVGAVWNGSSQTNSGDTFTTTISNAGSTAYDLEFEVTLPAGFDYVPSSVTTDGPAASAVQSGNTLTVTLGAGGEYDLTSGSSVAVSYGLTTDSTPVGGTYQLAYRFNARTSDANTNAKIEEATDVQNVLVQAGAAVLTLTPSTQVRGAGETAEWQATVTNTGFGGLFDVEIDLSDLYLNGSLTNETAVQSSPALAATGGPVYVLPYLAAGEAFVIDLTAEVAACDNLGIEVTSTELNGEYNSSKVAAIALDLNLPLVDFTPPNITLDYLTASSASMTVTNNTGSGTADNFSFQTNLNSLPVIISNVTGDFTYDPITGVFTLVDGSSASNPDAIEGGESATLNFDVVALDSCGSNGGSIRWTPVYTNLCGDVYAIPVKSGSISDGGSRPNVSLSMTSADDRVSVGEAGLFQLTLSADEIARIDTDPIVVEITAGSNGRIIGFDPAGSNVTPAVSPSETNYFWTVSKADAAAGATLDVLYEIGVDPCLGGESFSVSSSVSGVQSVVTASGDQCDLNASASTSVAISNNPSPDSDQFYNVTGTGFETGEPSADTTRDLAAGEGEFIPFEVQFEFESGYTGSWNGATFEDDFGGLSTQQLVGGSLLVSYGSGGSVTSGPVAVPVSAVTQSVGGLSINLDFLATAAFTNSASVSDTIIRFNYQTTIPYGELNGAASQGVSHESVLSLQNPGGTVPDSACIDDLELTFTQVLSYTIERADATLALSMPSILQECEVFDLTLSVGNRNDKNISNVIVTLNTPTSNFPYTYTVGQTPVYGGAFVGNISYNENGGMNPTFTFTPDELTADGTITVEFARKPGTATDPITATVVFDDRQTDPAGNSVFTTVGSVGPSEVQAGELILNVAPNTEVQINDGVVEWGITVQNVAAGVALNAEVINAIPPGLVVDEVATNAANAGFANPVGNVMVSGSEAVFPIGDLASGQIRKFKLIATLAPGSNCVIPDDTNIVTARWGCSTDDANSVVAAGPNIRFGEGAMQIVHDTTQSVARLCALGEVRIKVKNTGDGKLDSILVNEFIDEVTTGLKLVPGSVTYSTDNAPNTFISAANNPSGNGSSGSPYVFTISDDPGSVIPIAELVSVFDDDNTTVNEVTIRFSIQTTNANAVAGSIPSPSIQASGRADLFCGAFVDSPGVPFLLPTERPDITTALAVSNPSIGLGPADRTVGAEGEEVVWSFEITNAGNAVAENVRVQIPLTLSNGTATISVNGTSLGNYTGEWIDVQDIPAASGTGSPGAITVDVTETLGNVCVNTFDSIAQVTWGCSAAVGNNPNVIDTPTLNFASADVLMNPEFLPGDGFSREFARENDARGRVTVSMENTGAEAGNFVITENLPDNVEFDSSVIPTVTGTSGLVYDSVDLSDPTAPVFTFTGSVNYEEEFDFTFYVHSTIEDSTRTLIFPDLTVEEEIANGYDPEVSFPNPDITLVEYTNSCNDALWISMNADYDIRQPDLDINFAANNGAVADAVLNRAVFLDQEETFDIWIRNEGHAGSRATNTTVVITLGPAWTGASVFYGGTSGTASAVAGGTAYTFEPSDVGTFNTGSAREKQFTVTATATDVAGMDLGVKVDVDAVQILEDGSTESIDLSTDTRAFRVIGVDVEKELVTDSDSEDLTADERDLVIGEEVAFDLNVKFFGGAVGFNDIQNLIIRDSLGSSNAADRGLGLVSIDTTGTTIGVTTSTAPSDPVQTEIVNFTGSPGLITVVNDTFKARVVTRVLNDTTLTAVNSDEKDLLNHLGVAFDFYEASYHSNDSNDGFSGGTGRAKLHDDETVTVQRPTIEVVKEVRNLTDGGAFAATATGEAADIFEYRVVLTNSDTSAVTVPLFDLNWTDVVNSKLNLLDGSVTAAYAPGADTTGNGSVDVFFSGGVTAGIGGQLVVNDTNLTIGNSGQDFARLNAGESVTIHYFVRAVQGVNPSETIPDDVTVSADTLPSVSGSQTGTTGNTGEDDGALELSATASATINVFNVGQAKTIVTTSVGADNSGTVVIGEQVEFEIKITLPAGTAPNLKIVDTLSQEFELVELGSVVFGSAVSATLAPSITPNSGALPANGTPDFDLTWDFGNTTVTSSPNAADRSITVRYTVQIRNLELASLTKGGTFKNSAMYTFDGSPTELTDVTLTTAEAVVTVDKVALPVTELDAGDEVTFTVTVDNAGGDAAAHDLNIVDTALVGFTYKPGSTTVLSGAGQTSGFTGTLGDPDINVAGTTATWGRSQSSSVDLDLAAGGKLVFSYIATVDDVVEPGQVLTNSVVVDWTSLDGDPGPDLGVAVGTPGDANGERIGTGAAPNDYTDTDDASVTVDNTTSQTKAASGDSLPLDDLDDGFRVGDLVTYTVEVSVMEGTHEAFRILDTLPAGMAFEDFQAITPASGTDGFTYTPLVGGTTTPTLADTGTLVFDLGTVVNAGDADSDNDTLTLVYRARILDAAAIAVPDGDGDTDDSSLVRTNSVSVRYLDFEDEIFTTDPATVDVDVKQPELVLEKTRLTPVLNNKVDSGDNASYRVTVENTGDAPAYNATVLDILPVGMRAATPTLTVATLDGADILAALTPTYDSLTGEWKVTLTDAQFLEPGESLVLEYQVTVDALVAGGTLLTNTADVPSYFAKPSTDTTERREYDNVTPDSVDLTLILRVSGTVFEDLDVDRTLDSGEAWTDGSTVYVNLMQGGSIIDSVQVDPGTGDYVFVDVDPGSYSIIVTDFSTNPIPVAPPEFIFYESAPTDGTLLIVADDEDLVDQNFPLVRGSIVTGVVFEDNGLGAGSPNDGLQGAGEKGLGNVIVRLTDGAGTVFASTLTNGEGQFRFFVPAGVANGSTLVVEQFNLPSYLSTGGDEGTTGGTYARATDTITFTHVTGENQSDLLFGDVAPNSFITDGQQTIEPGAVAFYSHIFTAGTGGEVTFDISTVEGPAIPGWGQTLFQDTNCNGQLDAGEPRLTQPSAAVTVVAGQEICIIVKDSSPMGAPFGAQNVNTVTASFTYTNSDPALANDVLTRTDVTTIGNPTTSGLELLKAVDKAIASPGETITYTLTYTNNGAGPLADIVIYDSTPAFTTFAAAPVPAFPQTLTSVVIATPAVGASGGIIWTFEGELQPGETGIVTYDVTLDGN